MSEFNNINLVYNHPEPQVKEYYTKCLRLILSLRIKSEYHAKMLHKEYDLKGRTPGYLIDTDQLATISENDKTLWRYYQEMSGDFVDSSIVIKSLDVDDTVVLTKAMLASSPITKDNFRAGSYQLQLLLNKYPTMENAILGMLFPCDIQTVIDAKDFTILAWDTDLIEPQEDNVIYEMQSHINKFVTRWYNQFYADGTGYYYATMWASLIESLFLKLLTIRLSNCKTSRAHSFHVKMYLASHFELDKYMKYMTQRQIMFLYRNLEYISNNSGKSHIFHLLKDRLLTERGIPLSEVSVRHVDRFNEKHLPEIHARYKPINTAPEAEIDFTEFDKLVEKDIGVSDYNAQWYEREGASDEIDFKAGGDSIVQTKIVHSVVIDNTDAVEYPLPAVLFNHWGQWAKTGFYSPTSLVTFTDPRDFKVYTLTPMEAFVYYGIVLMYSVGMEPTTFKKFACERVLKFPLNAAVPTNLRTNLRNFSLGVKDPAYEFADRIYQEYITRPSLGIIYTSKTMFEASMWIYLFHRKLEQMVYSIQNPIVRARVSAMVDYMFTYTSYTVSEPNSNFHHTNVDTFITEKGLNNSFEMPDAQFKELLDVIFKSATGYEYAEEKRKSNIQKAMIRVFETLCSYTVKFIDESNETRLVPVAVPVSGITDVFGGRGFAYAFVDYSLGLQSPQIPIYGLDYYSGMDEVTGTIGVNTYHIDGAEQRFVDIGSLELSDLSGSISAATITKDTLFIGKLNANAEYMVDGVNLVPSSTFIIGQEYYLELNEQDRLDIIL